jgi:hypothetical protein
MDSLLKTLKKILLIAVIAFGIYYLMSEPRSAAESLRNIIDRILEILRNFADALRQFLDELVK